MSVLIISATEMEILPFQNTFPEAEVLITGVGAPVAVYILCKQLIKDRYKIVIQAGIAGTFDDSLSLGETVFVQNDRFADLGMMEKGIFTSVSEAGFSEGNAFPFQNEWLRNEMDLDAISALKKVNGITVNTVSDVLLPFNFSLENTIESMEGAALHYVCLQEGVPFLQLRAISNMAGERDKTKWKIKDAVENLNAELIAIYKKII